MEKLKDKVRKNREINPFTCCSRKRSRRGGIATARGSQDPIPLDLTTDVLTRLPAKSLVRFQCVSKLWSSIIHRRHFINSFATNSSSQPLLLSFIHNREHPTLHVFLSPQPKNRDEKSKSPSVASLGLTFPVPVGDLEKLVSLHGLICFATCRRTVICNPSTRQVIALSPNCKTKSIVGYCFSSYTYFGYDAVNDQHKVLHTHVGVQNDVLEHHVFALGVDNSWRSIQGTIFHHPAHGIREVCINGILYYGAFTERYNLKDSSVIVRFDVRSEELNLIKVPAGCVGFWKEEYTILINYDGKVALVDYFSLVKLGCFDFWVLEDAGTGEWSKVSRVMPFWSKGIVGNENFLHFHGTTHSGEIIMTPCTVSSNPLYIFHYDLKRNSIKRVEIEGLPVHDAFGETRLSLTFSDHLESIAFLEDYKVPGKWPRTLQEFESFKLPIFLRR